MLFISMPRTASAAIFYPLSLCQRGRNFSPDLLVTLLVADFSSVTKTIYCSQFVAVSFFKK